MRIAYVLLHLGKVYMHGGVGRKIAAQSGIWQEMGHTARLFLHTPDLAEFPNASVFPYENSGGLLRRELSRSRALGRMLDELRAWKPDVIYLRYGLFALPLQRIHSIAPVVVELNTDDVHEYENRGPFFASVNRLTRGITLGRAAGLAPVSHEIGRLPENARLKRPTCVVANGIDLARFEPLPAPDNPRPVLAFVGSPGMAWHGVDKLPGLARACPDVQIEVIGYQAHEVLAAGEDAPPNLRFHGFVDAARLRQLLASADASFGPLAFHRNLMTEGSSLKVREALAFGLPLILAYADTDLMDTQFDFILTIPVGEDNVAQHSQQIRQFAWKMRGQRVPRQVVAPRIDQRAKEQRRLEFFAQCAARRD